MTMPDLAQEITELRAANKQRDAELGVLTKNFNVLMDRLSKTPAPGTSRPDDVFSIRTGEDSMSSRGYSFAKMIGVLSGAIQPEEAKIEIHEVHDKLNDALVNNRDEGYIYAGRGYTGVNRFLAPLSTKFLPTGWVDQNLRRDIKAMVSAGTDGADLDEMRQIKFKQLQRMGYDRKTLSWLTETLGGALVAPPEMGELIELLRNKEALVNAGAKVVPLPPQGRLKYPRQTAASLTYWVGENSPISASDINTGEVTLQAKKLAVLIRAPNELIRFASPAAEALLRDDMTKSLALGLDLAGLEGAGGDNRPRGLQNFQNITTITSSDARTNGDALVGKDVYRMIAAVEEANAEFEGFIMRPKTLYKFYQLRADAVGQGDGAGPFLFNMIREAGDGVGATIAGHPVTKSTQVSQVRTKGTSSTLTSIYGGMWSDMLIGMFGAIEFASTTMGDTAFQNDQVWIRGILSADIAARHEASFVFLDNLDLTL